MEDDATAHPGPPANTPKLSSSKTKGRDMKAKKALPAPNIVTRAYQQEMLEMSLANNIIIALDTGSGKTHIAILRIKHELEREKIKLCWFVAPTVALCTQQHSVLSTFLPVSVGIISGSHHPDQWKNRDLWKAVVDTHRVIVSTPQVLLDSLRHGYISLGEQIALLIFDEAHHAGDKHPYNLIMKEFYFELPLRPTEGDVSHVNCRPAILGLSASPIYGSGDVERAFRQIESNLASKICTPQYSRDELAKYVHRPIFKPLAYFSSAASDDPPFSTNLASLSALIKTLDIEVDPYVVGLRRQLARAGQKCGVSSDGTIPPGTQLSPEYIRLDAKLSKTLSKQTTFTHKGLRDLERAAIDILYSIGSWAADWYVWSVVQHAKKASSPNKNNPYGSITTTWRSEEKHYLLSILNRLTLSPVSYYEDDIVSDTSDKVRVLIECLLDEKEEVEILLSAQPTTILPSNFTSPRGRKRPSDDDDDSESSPTDQEGAVAGYSGIIFVQRRDAVLALAEVLKNHPATKDQFRIGTLLGSSETSYRHAMMDITRSPAFFRSHLDSEAGESGDSAFNEFSANDEASGSGGDPSTLNEEDGPDAESNPPRKKSKKDTTEKTLTHFKLSLLNLIISTSVAEEGIDIQACGHVVRWDPPQNMASWVQSRGRARRRNVRSCFTLMYEVSPGAGGSSTNKMEEMIGSEVSKIERWMQLEKRMVEMYVKTDAENALQESMEDEMDDGDEDGLALRVESTGALINTHSAVSHLSHFCAIINRSGNADSRPIYDLDPPEYALGWHTSLSSTPGSLGPSTIQIPQSQGPWTSTVTLPRSLPIPQRSFTSGPVPFPNKLKAHRYAAFNAYKSLFEWGLLNEHLLPFTGGGGLEEEEEVKKLLTDIEKRKGMVGGVGITYDPWAPLVDPDPVLGGEGEDEMEVDNILVASETANWCWYVSTMEIDELEPLLLFTRRPLPKIERDEGPMLYIPGKEDAVRVEFTPLTDSTVDGGVSHSALRTFEDDSTLIEEAREYTRMIFWLLYATKLTWDDTSFAYLFLPVSHPTLPIPLSSMPTPSSSGSAQPHSVKPWISKRQWLVDIRRGSDLEHRRDVAFLANADLYTQKYGYEEEGEDGFIAVRKHMSFGRPLKFVGWQFEELEEELEDEIRDRYRFAFGRKHTVSNSKDGSEGVEGDVEMHERGEGEGEKMKLPYPLLIVEPFPPRTNFLHPLIPASKTKTNQSEASSKESMDRKYLIPKYSGIALYSKEEIEYANLMPSILRWLGSHLIVRSFLETRFTPSDPNSASKNSHLSSIPPSLLVVSLTVSSANEHYNYQRLETLGDTVLKFIVGIQLYGEHAMWHEGYLTRAKDHAVANVKLAKENVKRTVYRWIIRDMMLGKKWAPRYFPVVSGTKEGLGADAGSGDAGIRARTDGELMDEAVKAPAGSDSKNMVVDSPAGTSGVSREAEGRGKGKEKETSSSKKKKPKRKKGKGKSKGSNQELSQKLLADVVESLIGAAYEHGGFDLGYECAKFFDLGIKWQPLRSRLDEILARACPNDDLQIIPPQIADVESMIGYTFRHKAHLLEALTHASYQEHVATISYERMEFLGDGILDMIVTDYLYHASGKHYSPGHMHIRKSAVVNGHFLAYICLGLSRTVNAVMPQVTPSIEDEDQDPRTVRMRFREGVDEQEIHFWQCLMHSSQQVMDDQTNTSTRYELRKEEIREALENGSVFPWAGLTRLQAPKFFSDMIESIVGAVFVDSGGDMDVIQGLLSRIGILPVLERIVRNDMDVLHPVSRLSMWASKNQKEIEYVFEHQRGNVACIILVDGVEEVREMEKFRGKSSQEEVKFAAAEKAILQFKLRDGSKEGGVEVKRGKKGKGRSKL